MTTTGIESRSPSRGDDARHRQHVGALELGAHLGRRAAAEQLGAAAAALRLLLELRAQRSVADDPQPHAGQPRERVEEHVEALLLDEAADASTVRPCGSGAARSNAVTSTPMTILCTFASGTRRRR